MELNLCLGCMKEHNGHGPCPHCGFDASTHIPAAHHLPPGTILYGKYLLGKVLGEGGFGITYLGWDLNLELKVAVKEYFPNGLVTRMSSFSTTVTAFTGNDMELYAQGLERFVDEARSLARFWQLEGIVTVKDYFQTNKTAYIVMEFVEGKTLRELSKTNGGRMPADQVFHMMRPVMDALENVHGAGMIHRDICPDNLMVDDQGHVKLLNLGGGSVAASGNKPPVLLKTGYAASEQYLVHGELGPWTDIYGLCAVMYFAITGQAPPDAMERIMKDTLKWPSQLGIKLNPSSEATLMKGLSLFPKDRYHTIKVWPVDRCLWYMRRDLLCIDR